MNTGDLKQPKPTKVKPLGASKMPYELSHDGLQMLYLHAQALRTRSAKML